jgi:hypothetical protein
MLVILKLPEVYPTPGIGFRMVWFQLDYLGEITDCLAVVLRIAIGSPTIKIGFPAIGL